jgi:hypothetical protein
MGASATAEADFYLPDECWQSIFKFLIDDGGDRWQRRDHLISLSVVSKQFLTVTNSLISYSHSKSNIILRNSISFLAS